MQKLRLAFGVLVTAALFGFFSYVVGPGLLRDFRLRSIETAEVASELTEGDCRVYVLAVNFCSLKLNTADGGTLDDTLFFVDLSLGNSGYDIVAREAAGDPSQITTSLALDMFWDRVLTFVVFLGLMGLGFVAGLRQLFAREPQPA